MATGLQPNPPKQSNEGNLEKVEGEGTLVEKGLSEKGKGDEDERTREGFAPIGLDYDKVPCRLRQKYIQSLVVNGVLVCRWAFSSAAEGRL